MDELTAWAGGPLLVLGAAGTGKTTLVADAAAHRLRAGLPPALVLAGSRQAASELRDRVVLAAGRASVQPPILTVHALALSLLQRYGDPEDGPPRLLTAPEQEFRIRELLAGWGADRWGPELAVASTTGTFARQVRAALARARQWGLDPDDVARLGREAGEPAWEALGEFMEEYLAVLDLEGTLDYAELVHRARILLTRPEVAEPVRARYAAIWVDELAELDPAALAFVRALAPADGTVVGLADPDTSINRFRGADPRAVAEFRRLFAPLGGEVPVVTLGRSFRLGPQMTDAVVGVVRRLGAPPVEPAQVAAYRAPEPAGGPGRVEVWSFPTQTEQAQRIAAELRAAHLVERVPWAEMAVLVRSGKTQLPPLARALTDAGIPIEVAGDEIGLASELAVRPLLLALAVAARGGSCDADEATRLLTSGWGGLDAVALRGLGRSLRDGRAGVTGADAVAEALSGGHAADGESATSRDVPGDGWWGEGADAAGAVGRASATAVRACALEGSPGGGVAAGSVGHDHPGGSARGAEVVSGGGPGGATSEVSAGLGAGEAQPVGQAREVVAARAALLATAAGLVAEGRRPEEVLWALWSGVPWPETLRSAALRGGEAAVRAHRDLDAVVALFALAAQSQAPGGARGVRAFLAEVAEQQIPADVEREAAVAGRGVRLLTAHRAKGRAWDLVVIAGAQEGAWPDVRRRGSVFDPERLRPDGLGAGVETRELVASERRLFLLACTRARRRLLVTTVAGTEGEADQPSRFVTELGVALREPGTRPESLHTLRELVASLRVASADPTASPELREAAAVRLARLADATDDDGRPLVPDADPARWWGTRAPTGPAAAPASGPFELTPSQLSSLLSCPRRYFLEREAKADPPRGGGAILGTVIHALAERAAGGELTLAEASAHLDEIWGDIPFAAAWLSESERVEATNAVARLLAWQEAHASAEVVGAEVPFAVDVEVEGQTIRVRGTVDRIERLPDGTLRVVDFKSSRRVPTKAEVEAHEQVGVYQLAVEAGAFESVAPGSATSAGGELVFLRDGDQLPKVLGQPPLSARPHLGDDPDELRYPTWVHHRLGVACATLSSGRWDASPGGHCRLCPFGTSCPATSGQVTP